MIATLAIRRRYPRLGSILGLRQVGDLWDVRLSSMALDQARIDAAAAQLAHVARFPSYAEATFAYTCPELMGGDWLHGPADHPLTQFALYAVRVPECRGDAWTVAVARCRVALEDAIAAETA
jgi:hypothetical protein